MNPEDQIRDMVTGATRAGAAFRRADPVGDVTFDWWDGPAHHVVTVRLSSPSIGHLIAKARDLYKNDVDDGIAGNAIRSGQMTGIGLGQIR